MCPSIPGVPTSVSSYSTLRHITSKFIDHVCSVVPPWEFAQWTPETFPSMQHALCKYWKAAFRCGGGGKSILWFYAVISCCLAGNISGIIVDPVVIIIIYSIQFTPLYISYVQIGFLTAFWCILHSYLNLGGKCSLRGFLRCLFCSGGTVAKTLSPVLFFMPWFGRHTLSTADHHISNP